MTKTSLSLAFLALALEPSFLSAAPETREFRPLEAKTVSIAPAVMVVHRAIPVKDQASALETGWDQFDSQDWGGAIDSFLSALDEDPESAAAAEGLGMSLYHSGDHASAYRLGVELTQLMPVVTEQVSKAVESDVRCSIAKEDLVTAKQLLENFPADDPAYAPSHRLLADALALSSMSMNPDLAQN